MAEWVCPWGICNHEEAQACRAQMHPRKGCGGRFPGDVTPDQAREEVQRPWPRSAADGVKGDE